MQPVILHTPRLVLDLPEARDADLVTQYCQDPLFERYLVTPWPYERRHALAFLNEHVPARWADGTEATWALRTAPGGPMLGVVCVRFARPDVGYWLGAPNRGQGFMAEAVRAVAEWTLGRGGSAADHVEWGSALGNLDSARVARSAGFRYTGTRPSIVVDRDGRSFRAWHGERTPSTAPDARASWQPILGRES
jgi:RimJ/RimL family protein N-acetyltransferase